MSTINLTAPRNYGEMTEKQIRYVAALQMHGLPDKDIWLKCLIKFSGIKPFGGTSLRYYFVKKGYKGYFSLKLEEMNSFCKKMDFITQNYIGITPVKVGKYAPCDNQLCDTIFMQYLEAENYYQSYIFSQKPEYLFKLMATLYQDGAKYDNKNIARRAKYFSRHASELEKLIVVMWMIGVKEFFMLKFDTLFEKPKSNEIGESKAPDMYAIIQNQIRMLTEGDITKRDQVLRSNTWDALDEMNAKQREAKEMEKQMKNA